MRGCVVGEKTIVLLPCPFCGGPAGPATKRATVFPSRRWKVACADSSCGAHYGYWHPNEWNHRGINPIQVAPQPEQSGVVAAVTALERALDFIQGNNDFDHRDMLERCECYSCVTADITDALAALAAQGGE